MVWSKRHELDGLREANDWAGQIGAPVRYMGESGGPVPYVPPQFTERQSKCLRGDHEGGTPFESGLFFVDQYRSAAGEIVNVKFCKHCRSLYVEE